MKQLFIVLAFLFLIIVNVQAQTNASVTISNVNLVDVVKQKIIPNALNKKLFPMHRFSL